MPQPIRLIIEGENATAGMFKSVFGELNRLNKETAVSAKSISRLFTGSIVGREFKRLISSALQSDGAENLRKEFQSIKKSIDEVTVSLLEGLRPAISTVAGMMRGLSANLRGGLSAGAMDINARAQSGIKSAQTHADVLAVKVGQRQELAREMRKIREDIWTGTDVKENQLGLIRNKANSLDIDIAGLTQLAAAEATNNAAGSGLMRLFGRGPNAMGILRGFGGNARGPLAALFSGLAGGQNRLGAFLNQGRALFPLEGQGASLTAGLRTPEERAEDELRTLRTLERMGFVSGDTGRRQRNRLAESLRGDVRGFGAAGELMGEESRFLTQQRGQTDPQIRALEKANSLNERQAKALEEARKSLDRIEKKLDVPVNGKI